MPSSGEKKLEQQRKRRRAQNEPTHLVGGLTWNPCLVVGQPVPEGQLVVVGQKKKVDERAEPSALLPARPAFQQLSPELLRMERPPTECPAPSVMSDPLPPPPPHAEPSFPWTMSSLSIGCSLHDGSCDRSWCPVALALSLLRTLARRPCSDARRHAFEEAYAIAAPIIASAERRRDEAERMRELMELPEWYGTYHDPFIDDAPIYPRYDGPFHVMLRDEPCPGYVWVSQPEEIAIDYTDGGPPKLHEWQIPEYDLDASYITLPWRIPRRVLETSGAHEAERLGNYMCLAIAHAPAPAMRAPTLEIMLTVTPRQPGHG